MELYELFICLALALLGFALFKQESLRIRKFGLLILWLGSGLGVYFLTDKLVWGLAMMMVWIMIPLAEILIVLRKLRLPREREFHSARPPLENFPVLREVTQEFNDLGFNKVDDCDLTPHFHQTYYRLFEHPQNSCHAIIGFISQGEIGFSFHAFLSEEQDGKIWMTWDYPLTYGLKIPPSVRIYRVTDAESIEELWQAHQDFLKINQVAEDQLLRGEGADPVRARLMRALHGQVDYNLQQGILLPEPTSQEHLRYSWRGIWFVTRQMFRDVLGY